MAVYARNPIFVPGSLSQFGLAAPLFVLRAADMTLTTDQTCVKCGAFTKWIPTSIVGILVSGAFGVACLGGIYNAAAKGGTAIVAAAQSWANLTAANKIVVATLAAGTTDAFIVSPILSLTTGNTGALTADLFVYGSILD